MSEFIFGSGEIIMQSFTCRNKTFFRVKMGLKFFNFDVLNNSHNSYLKNPLRRSQVCRKAQIFFTRAG